MADALFESQALLGTADLAELAARAGIQDTSWFRECTSRPETEARVALDEAVIQGENGRGTPAVFLDGVYLGTSPTLDELLVLVRKD
jgi:protein-disulfide isomerase